MQTFILKLSSIVHFNVIQLKCFEKADFHVCRRPFFLRFSFFASRTSFVFLSLSNDALEAFFCRCSLRLRLIYLAIKTIKTEFRHISQPLCDRNLRGGTRDIFWTNSNFWREEPHNKNIVVNDEIQINYIDGMEVECHRVFFMCCCSYSQIDDFLWNGNGDSSSNNTLS